MVYIGLFGFIKVFYAFATIDKVNNFKASAADGTDIVLVFNQELKVWEGELTRGIEQDIEVHIADKNYRFRTVPTTRMGDDLFDD